MGSHHGRIGLLVASTQAGIALLIAAWIREAAANPFHTRLQFGWLSLVGATFLGAVILVLRRPPDHPLLILTPAVASTLLGSLLWFWLNGTPSPLGFAGDLDVMQRLAIIDRWSTEPVPSDPLVPDLPNWYPPAAFWLIAQVVRVTGASAATGMRWSQIVAGYALPWICWLAWRPLADRRVAALASLAPVATFGSVMATKPDQWLVALLVPPGTVAVLHVLDGDWSTRRRVVLGALLGLLFLTYSLFLIPVVATTALAALGDPRLRSSPATVTARLAPVLLGVLPAVILFIAPLVASAVEVRAFHNTQQLWWDPELRLSFLGAGRGVPTRLVPAAIVGAALLAFAGPTSDTARRTLTFIGGVVGYLALAGASVFLGTSLLPHRGIDLLAVVAVMMLMVGAGEAVRLIPDEGIARGVIAVVAVSLLVLLPTGDEFDAPKMRLAHEGPLDDGGYPPFADYRPELDRRLGKEDPTPFRQPALDWTAIRRHIEDRCGRNARDLLVLSDDRRSVAGRLPSWQFIPYSEVWAGPTTRYRDRLDTIEAAVATADVDALLATFDRSPFPTPDVLMQHRTTEGFTDLEFGVAEVPEGRIVRRLPVDTPMPEAATTEIGPYRVITLCELRPDRPD